VIIVLEPPFGPAIEALRRLGLWGNTPTEIVGELVKERIRQLYEDGVLAVESD
jgi:hypothetical protein